MRHLVLFAGFLILFASLEFARVKRWTEGGSYKLLMLHKVLLLLGDR